MHALIDIEHAEASRFDDIANTLRKAVADPRAFRHIRAKPSSTADVRLVFRHFDSCSVEKALRNLSFSLGVPSKSAKGNWGEKHIERPSRLRDLNNVGFSSARDFVEYTCKDFDAIYKNGRNLIVAKREKRRNLLLYVELVPSKDGNFYDVKTAFPTRKNFLQNKTLLWEKPISSVQKSEKERAQSNQFFNNKESHRANFTGISDGVIIPQSAKNASEISKKYQKKSLRPRFMVRKSVARQILRQELPSCKH